MKEVGTVSREDYSYPVLLDEKGLYHIDLGGAYGISDPFEFANDDEAISFFDRSLEEEGY